MNFLVQITPTAIWECISWIPGFHGKTRRNKNDFFSGGVMCEKLPFFHSPAVVRKGTFLHNFFFFEYRFWSQVGASGVVNLSFLRMYGEKMINFPAQWHIKEFNNLHFFEFWIFCFNSSYGYLGVYFMAPRVHWQNAKKWEWFFSRGVMCEKLPFFHSPAVVRKGTFLHNFFFSEYRFWSQVGASGVVYLSFLRIYGERMIHFPAQWHIKEF